MAVLGWDIEDADSCRERTFAEILGPTVKAVGAEARARVRRGCG